MSLADALLVINIFVLSGSISYLNYLWKSGKGR